MGDNRNIGLEFMYTHSGMEMYIYTNSHDDEMRALELMRFGHLKPFS